MERWSGKLAAVTGASSGIGAACAKALLDHNIRVVGLDIRDDRMEEDVKARLPEHQRPHFHVMKCDMRSEAEIHNAFATIDEQLGGADILVNSAGIVNFNAQIVDRNNTNILREIIDVNLMAVAMCTREAFQSIKRRNAEGHVIMINSIVGKRIIKLPLINWNVYPATKHAMTALTEVLRQEFLQQQTRIKITSICPGMVQTNMLPNMNDYIVDMPTIKAEDVADAAMYCLGTPASVQIREIVVEPFAQML